MKNIAIIGGGTGTSTLLSGLKRYPVDLSVIISTADDGGSSGRLRNELGIMPPGDIRQCLLAMSEAEPEVRSLFSYRFSRGKLEGHPVGNLILAALEQQGNIKTAITAASQLLKVRGQVVPVSVQPTVLAASFLDGSVIKGQHAIETSLGRKPLGISRLRLIPRAEANPIATAAIRRAQVIVFGPGDLYTSILPNLLVPGILDAIKKSRAQKVMVTNLMTRHGQTDGFTAPDFLKVLQEYVKIDVAVVNTQKPSAKWLGRYKKEQAEFVQPKPDLIGKLGIRVITDNFIANTIHRPVAGDPLQRSFLRHDAQKVARYITSL